MKKAQQKFAIQLLLLSVVLYGILYGVFTKLGITGIPILLMLGLLYVVNVGSFILVSITREKKPRSFVFAYMGLSLGRLLFCALFVFMYALSHKETGRVFALTFGALYCVYTTLEIAAIYQFFNAKQP